MSDFLEELMRVKRAGDKLKAEGKCTRCGKEVNPENEFRDSLSKKEFRLSGMCQQCQDEFYVD